MKKILGCFFIFMVMITSQIFAGNAYYIDGTNGNDLNDGLSVATAWRTINKANFTLTAGDTVYILAGTYDENNEGYYTIKPSNSGSYGNYITYTNYDNDDVIIRGAYHGVYIAAGTNYIKIDGLKIHGENITDSDIRIGVLLYSDYNIIQNCSFQYMNYNTTVIRAIWIHSNANNNQILKNKIMYIGKENDQTRGNGIHVDGDYNLIQENDIDYCGHDCICCWGTCNILRSNTMEGHWGKCMGLADADGSDSRLLVEDNIVHNTNKYYLDMPRPGSQSQFRNIIFRRNVIYDTDGPGISQNETNDHNNSNARFYHNVVYNAGREQVSQWDSAVTVTEHHDGCLTDVDYRNNIFYNNSDGIRYRDYANPNDFTVTNNHWNAHGDPYFQDEANYNFLLNSSSPCIDSGAFLTSTSYSGSGTQIPLEDAGYFIDGFGTVEGDLIQLEGQTQAARIISIDYDNNTITVDTPLNWYSGQGVSLPYSGSAPDIGAYEYESAAAPLNTNMNASPTSGQVPLSVNFTGGATGGSPPYTYSWNFGDSASSSSQNPSHTYSTAGDYTATLTVTDSASNQDSESVTINASTPPSPLVASLVASPTSGQAPLTVNFTGSATGGSPPYTYSWNFGDSASSSTQNPSHTYSTSGNYTATLTVSDSASSQDIESVTIDASAPHTVATPNTPSGPTNGSPNVSYTYTTGGSSCSQGHSIEYRFDWGDESYSAWSSSTIASHSWPAAGSYAVKAQARCSINHSIASGWSSEKTVTIATSSYFNLAVSSATGSPTPDQGGTTDPLPGNHSYPSGNSVLISAITNTDYRFSKWTGDVSSSDTYDEEITVSMNQNKSISAYFCTKCGDVNGDLNITPADAQEVFEIFLGIISDPTDCQKENADVNCDGTKTDPKITPGDAQAIFEKFLGINDLPGDCSCKSRAESAGSLAIQERAFVQLERSANINLIINDIELKPGTIIAVPVIIDNPSNIKAFGFDILFESEILEFVGVMRTELLKDFNEVDGNEIAQGVLRVGGYSSEPIRSHSPGALIRLIFKVTGETEEPCPFLITNTVDDLENASFQNRTYMRKKIRRKDIVF